MNVRRIPALGIFTWKKLTVLNEDGTKRTVYEPVEEVHEAWLRISEAEKLPFGLSAEVIRKLIAGGFVEAGRAAPNNATVNILSLLEHIEATRADWDFWKRDGRRARFENGVDFSEDEPGAVTAWCLARRSHEHDPLSQCDATGQEMPDCEVCHRVRLGA